MLYFDRVGASEGIASKEWDISHHCHFLNYSFKFQPNACRR